LPSFARAIIVMIKTTRKHVRGKPNSPYPEFHLFPHATPRWTKKIGGKLHYFGPTKAAVEKLLATL